MNKSNLKRWLITDVVAETSLFENYIELNQFRMQVGQTLDGIRILFYSKSTEKNMHLKHVCIQIVKF